MPRPARPVGWNWKNSMSSSGRPARNAIAMPSPVSVWAFDVVLKTLPAPPVAKITDLARNVWISPVDSSNATTPATETSSPAAAACGSSVRMQVKHVVLVEELHVLLDALLVQRLQNHVAGAVGRVAGAAHGGLAVLASVAAKAALVDVPVLGAVERQAHLLEVEHGVDRLGAQDLGGVLVHQVVAALDRVEDVPLGVVVLDIAERRRHAALRGARVRARGVELGEHRGVGARRALEGRAHAGAAGANDDDVKFMFGHGSSSQIGAEARQDGRVHAGGARVKGEDHERAEDRRATHEIRSDQCRMRGM